MSSERCPLTSARSSDTLIKEAQSFTDVDTSKLRELIQRGFGRSLRDNYFGSNVNHIIIAGNYAGAAIFIETQFGMYLTKFVVDPGIRGRGVGGELWSHAVRTHQRMFWRAHCQNTVNTWYSRVCDGFIRFDKWNVYWRGAFALCRICDIVDYALNAPVDLLDSHESALKVGQDESLDRRGRHEL